MHAHLCFCMHHQLEYTGRNPHSISCRDHAWCYNTDPVRFILLPNNCRTRTCCSSFNTTTAPKTGDFCFCAGKAGRLPTAASASASVLMMMAETGGDTYCHGGNTRIPRPPTFSRGKLLTSLTIMKL